MNDVNNNSHYSNMYANIRPITYILQSMPITRDYLGKSKHTMGNGNRSWLVLVHNHGYCVCVYIYIYTHTQTSYTYLQFKHGLSTEADQEPFPPVRFFKQLLGSGQQQHEPEQRPRGERATEKLILYVKYSYLVLNYMYYY